MHVTWQGLCCCEVCVDHEAGPSVFAAMAQAAADVRASGVCDGATSAFVRLACYWRRMPADRAAAEAAIRAAVADRLATLTATPTATATRIHTVPVVYDGADLAAAAAQLDRGIADLISAQSAVDYAVAAIGFTPDFPYLWGLPAELALPRRAQPRVAVPAGSVAIGGDQCGIYPRRSPGGWWLLGHCDPACCAAMEVGDRVRFVPQEVL